MPRGGSVPPSEPDEGMNTPEELDAMEAVSAAFEGTEIVPVSNGQRVGELTGPGSAETQVRASILEAMESATSVEEILSIGETYNAEDMCWEEVVPGKAFRSDPLLFVSYQSRTGNLGEWVVINAEFVVVDPVSPEHALTGEKIVITCSGEKVCNALYHINRLGKFPFVACIERRLTSNGFFVVNLVRATPEGMSKRDKIRAQRMRLLERARARAGSGDSQG